LRGLFFTARPRGRKTAEIAEKIATKARGKWECVHDFVLVFALNPRKKASVGVDNGVFVVLRGWG